MSKITNTYHKRLTFPKLNLSIDSNEIREYPDEIVRDLTKNHWIKLVSSVKKETKRVDKKIIRKHK